MPVKTPLVRYNLKERGRKFRGSPRNFNVSALCDAINGGETQERVRHRDMFGYYGHWPRMVFGLDPREGGVVDGVVVKVDPAFVTTKLKCAADGTIEHEAEFLDNDMGRAAAGLFKSSAGGFSSVIHEQSNRFFGFDYVLEPNFSTNRPYALSLDSVGKLAVTMDDVRDYIQSALDIATMLDGVNAENRRLENALARKGVLVDELTAELAKRTPVSRAAILDAIGETAQSKNAKLFRDAHRLAHATLDGVRVDPSAQPDAEVERARSYTSRMLAFFR